MSHLVGLILFAIAAVWASLFHPAPMGIGAAAVGILFIVAVWEWGSFHGGWTERGLGVPTFLRRYVAWRIASRDQHDKAVSQSGDKG